MTKGAFLSELHKKLSPFLTEEDIQKTLEFYSEAIDDRKEEGMSPEEAVDAVGTPSEIANRLLDETPVTKIVKKKIGKKKNKAVWILLLLGSPLWIALLLAFFACIAAVYVVGAALLLSLFAVTFALLLAFPAGVVFAVVVAVSGEWPAAFVLFGLGLCAAGLGLFMFLLCHPAIKAAFRAAAFIPKYIKSLLVGKENEQ